MGRFYTLDLMRGVAAIAVMLYHADRIVPRGYLAVDLFFVLSGFVLLRAYGPRLAQGELGPVLFRRAVRLGPLMLAGAVVGVAINGFPPNDPGFLFPANIPLWSLAFEVIASVAFILLFRFGPVVWTLAWTAGFYFTLVGILEYHTADLGYRWETAGYGLARTAFSFCTGIAIARLPVRRDSSWLAVPLVALTLAVTMLPASVPGIADIAAVLILFPACVALAVKFDAPLVRFATWLGAASYALYAIHHPMVKWAVATDWAVWPTLIVLHFAALALERWYDRPVRRWLTERVERLRSIQVERFGSNPVV
jgi:peptidoglycan/LPS O-acetylase OafA/YrhL